MAAHACLSAIPERRISPQLHEPKRKPSNCNSVDVERKRSQVVTAKLIPTVESSLYGTRRTSGFIQSLCAQSPVAHDGHQFRRVSSVVSQRLSVAGAFAQGHMEAVPVSAEKRALHRKRWKLAGHIVFTLVWRHRHAKNSWWGDPTYRQQLDQVQFTSASELDGKTRRAALFDPTEFKASRQMRMTNEAKRILTKKPEERTAQEIYYANIALRGVRLISDYPLKMQLNLAKYGQFESYEAGRLVLREDHKPTAFYFVLYGNVLVAVYNEDSQDAETKCVLGRDESFGELSIMLKSPRQSSIITRNYTELLSIDLEVYEKVFMVCGQSSVGIADQEHQRFVESLFFLRDWPVDLLTTTKNSGLVLFSYFKRGQMMVKNSNDSDWIYVIKSGSVAVIKRLTYSTKSDEGGEHRLQVSSLPEKKQKAAILREKLLKFQEQKIKSQIGSLDRIPIRGCVDPDYTGPKLFRPSSVSAVPSKRSRAPMDEKKYRPQTAAAKDTSPMNAVINTISPDSACGTVGHSIFVRAQTLVKGEVFGLAHICFKDQPSFSLISNGAECLMINKQFYLNNCTEQMKARLHNQVSPYPTDKTLQRDLSTASHWQVYKRGIVREVCSRRTGSKVLDPVKAVIPVM